MPPDMTVLNGQDSIAACICGQRQLSFLHTFEYAVADVHP